MYIYIPIIHYNKPQINYQIRYQDFSFLIRCMNCILVLHIELPRHAVIVICLHILVNIVWKLEFLSQAVFEQNFNIKLC